MPCPEKFRESLERFNVNPALILEINKGYETLASSSPKKLKAEYFARAMNLLDENLDYQARYELLDYNACCKGGSRDKAIKALAKEIKDLPLTEKVKKLWNVPNMGKPILNDDQTIKTGIYYHVNGEYLCPCPNFNNLKNRPEVSATYCLCCAAHFRYHYQNALGVKLKTKEIISSPLNSAGKSPCEFLFECE